MSTIQRVALLAALAVVASVASVGAASAATFAPAGANFAVDSSSVTLAMRASQPIICSVKSTGTLPKPAGSTAAISPPAFACTWPGMGGSLYADVTASGSWSLEATSTTALSLKGTGLQIAAGGINPETGKKYAPSCIVNLTSPLSASGAWSNVTHQLTVSKKIFSYVPIPPSHPFSCHIFGFTDGPNLNAQIGWISGTFALSNTSNPAVPITVQP